MSWKTEGDALVDWLAGESWPESLGQQRTNAVFWNNAEDELKTYVTPIERRRETGTRSGSRLIRRHGILLIQKLDVESVADELERQDELIEIAESIEQKLDELNRLNGQDVAIAKDEATPAIDAEAAAAHVFLAAVIVDIWS